MPFAFENLHVYQKAVTFADAVCTITRELPRGYFFLADQLNRASLSIAANIAEGNGRFTKGERRNFFGIARGSLHECVNFSAYSRRTVLSARKTTPKNLSQNPMTPRWVGNGPDARRRIEAYLTVDDTLRSDNQADGPFPAHPPGDASFARTRRRSSSPYLSIDMPRRRSLIAGEICIVAGPLGSEIDSKSGISKRFTKSTCFSRRVE